MDTVLKTTEPFSLFCTVFAVCNLEVFGSILKHFEAFGSLPFSLFCTVLTLKRQNSVNSELLDSSKTAKTVPWSQSLFHSLHVPFISLQSSGSATLSVNDLEAKAARFFFRFDSQNAVSGTNWNSRHSLARFFHVYCYCTP